MDREEFEERKRIGAEYLFRIARASGEKRRELLVEWAEKLYDARANLRMSLVKSVDDLPPLLAELRLLYSGTVMPLLAAAQPNDSEAEAIRLALEGRESECLAELMRRLPAEAAAEENSGGAAQGAPAGKREDPIAAKRRARVDEYLDEVFRVKKKRIFRRDIWKTAGYQSATEFQRWQRNDPRSSKVHDRAFTRVLTEKPHLK
jgi:hypothetical protein